MKLINDPLIPIFSIIAFFGMAGGALLGPVLPLMVEPLDTTAETVGWIMGIYTLSTAISMLVFAVVTDQIGRKRILVPCLLINGIAGFACYFAPNITILLILRFIQGIGIAGMIPIAMTMIGELYEGVDRVHAMGRISITTSLGAISAPLIGGSMAVVSWNYPFLFYALTIPLAIIGMFILPETNPAPVKKKRMFKKMFSILRDIRISYIMFLCFVTFFLLFTIVIYIPFILINIYGFTAQKAGLVIGIQGISMVMAASQAKLLSRRFQFSTLVFMGFLFMGIAILGMGISDSLNLIYLLLLIFGIGFGITQPMLSARITYASPKNMMGSTVLTFNTMKYVGQTAAPAILGPILMRTDLSTIFILSSVLGFFIVASTLYARRRSDLFESIN